MEATPGPWTAHPCGSRNRTHASVTGPRGECIASCAAYPRTPEARARANARAALVAAAPDLLQALQWMLSFAEGYEDEDHVIYARAAIARAKGGQE